MKAQGLPMTTIVLIILVIIVLAGVAIFFFTQMTTGGTATDEQQLFAKCQSACLRLQQEGLTCTEYKAFVPGTDGCCKYDKCTEVTCC